MEVTFVPFGPDFLEASWNWLQDDELRRLIDADQISKEQQLGWYNSLGQRNDYHIWGIAVGGRPIGACGLKSLTEKDAEYWGYIGEKKYWGMGIGRSILSFAEDVAREYGLNVLNLKVLKINSAAIRLYQKQDYKTVGEDERTLFMQKPII